MKGLVLPTGSFPRTNRTVVLLAPLAPGMTLLGWLMTEGTAAWHSGPRALNLFCVATAIVHTAFVTTGIAKFIFDGASGAGSIAHWIAVRRTSLDGMPGGVSRAVCQLFLSRKLTERIVDPILSDMGIEWREAVDAGQVLKAWVALLSGHCDLVLALANIPISAFFQRIFRH